VLDEPSIGLPSADNDRLLQTLEQTCAIKATQWILSNMTKKRSARPICLWISGPGAGCMAGGSLSTWEQAGRGGDDRIHLTGQYLPAKRQIAGCLPKRRKGNNKKIRGQGHGE